MADDFQVRLDGLDEILNRMTDLSRSVQGRIARRAVRAGANQIAKQARQNAKSVDDPETPTAIYKNITVRAAPKVARQNKGAADMIGIVGGAKSRRKNEVRAAFSGARGGDTFYWRFLEFGTSKMPAKPFMRPAITQASSAAFDATADTFKRLINEEIIK